MFPPTTQDDAEAVEPTIERDRIALGIRQPWIELILRGHKRLEIRTQPTNVRGTIYLYASKTIATIPEAGAAIRTHGIEWDASHAQTLVGSVDIVGCRPARPDEAADVAGSCLSADALRDRYAWELARPVRYASPLRPRFLPYGVWFYPFRRRASASRRPR